jgi:hypothetical protein
MGDTLEQVYDKPFWFYRELQRETPQNLIRRFALKEEMLIVFYLQFQNLQMGIKDLVWFCEERSERCGKDLKQSWEKQGRVVCGVRGRGRANL